MKNVDGLMVLDKFDIERSCRSFYAEAPKAGVSDKYAFVNSRDIAVALWGMGWLPVSAKESRSIDPTNQGYTKHMVRFAHRNMQLSKERIELVMVNSHNRAASFKLMAGIFRLVCSNGLIVKTSDFGTFAIKHLGDIKDQVEDAVRKLSGQAGMISDKMDQFKTINLTRDQMGVYSMAAHEYYFDEPKSAPISPAALLLPRRSSDASDDGYYSNGSYARVCKPDLWTVYNTVQENLMKGGLRGRNVTTHSRVKTREVKSIDRDVKLNQALWSLTEKMAALAISPAAA